MRISLSDRPQSVLAFDSLRSKRAAAEIGQGFTVPRPLRFLSVKADLRCYRDVIMSTLYDSLK